jgi:hypothetical protein
MTPEDAEEYTQALSQVVAGGWRQIALGKRLGVPELLKLSTRQWVEDRLGGYVRLSIEERREAAAELTAEGMSRREVGDVLGVDPMTVQRDVAPVANATKPAEATPAPVANATDDRAADYIDQHLAEDPTLTTLADRRRVQQALAKAWTFTEYDPEFAARVLDDDHIKDLNNLITNLTGFRDAIHRARTQTLAEVRSIR